MYVVNDLPLSIIFMQKLDRLNLLLSGTNECLLMQGNTDVEQIEICLCLGQISLAVSGGGACGGRNGGARWRPVGLSAFLKNV